MRQVAPDPKPLRFLVDRLEYKPGWQFTLTDLDRGQGSEGLTLVILRVGPDSYDHARILRVNHYMPVPPAAFDARCAGAEDTTAPDEERRAAVHRPDRPVRVGQVAGDPGARRPRLLLRR